MQGQYGNPPFGQPLDPHAMPPTQPSGPSPTPQYGAPQPYPQAPVYPQAQQAPYPSAPPQGHPQASQAYGAPSYPAQPPPSYGPAGYNPSAYGAPHSAQPHSAQPPAMPGFGHVGALPQAPAINMPKVSGLPAPLAFGMAVVAVAVALVFDVVFLHVHIPGVGGYAWYLTTALSFMGAGYGAANWTRASRTVALTAIVFAGILYGVLDLGLGLVLENLPMQGAIMLGAQGVAIAVITGFGGVYRGLRAKYED